MSIKIALTLMLVQNLFTGILLFKGTCNHACEIIRVILLGGALASSGIVIKVYTLWKVPRLKRVFIPYPISKFCNVLCGCMAIKAERPKNTG